MVRISWRGYGIEVGVDPTYTPGSADNVRSYLHEVALGSLKERPLSRYGVSIHRDDLEIASCVVLAPPGGTTVRGRSAVIVGDRLFLAIGNQVCALQLPSLLLDWHLEADSVACYGLVVVPELDGLISHGELDIVRLTLDGTVVWRQQGRDMFSGDLTVDAAAVRVTDWNGATYSFNITTGEANRREA